MDPLSILLFIVLVALSAFFSGTEIALMTLSKHSIQSLVRERRWGSVSLEAIKSDNDALLITILIGNNLVNVGASALATVTVLSLSKTLWLPEESGIAIATGAVTLILLLFGEITPKTICTRYATPVSLAVAPLYRGIIFVMRPISFSVGLMVKLISWIFVRNRDAVKKISYAEVEAFIDMSHEEGEVEADERRQIKNILSLSETSAESVMTPRVNVEFVSRDMTVDDVCEFFMNSSHTRMPVYQETRDNVDYVITFREAFRLQKEGCGLHRLVDLELEKIMKVPLTQPLDALFEKFQKSRKHIALVLDEHGGTAGVVTMEDILEEVFGDIKDEKDQEEVYIRRKQNGSLEVIGSVLLDDIIEEFNIDASELWIRDEYLGEPISYVMLAEKEQFPSIGEEVVFSWPDATLVLRVLQTDGTVIERVECVISR